MNRRHGARGPFEVRVDVDGGGGGGGRRGRRLSSRPRRHEVEIHVDVVAHVAKVMGLEVYEAFAFGLESPSIGN